MISFLAWWLSTGGDFFGTINIKRGLGFYPSTFGKESTSKKKNKDGESLVHVPIKRQQ